MFLRIKNGNGYYLLITQKTRLWARVLSYGSVKFWVRVMSIKFSIRSSSMCQILGLKTLSNSSNLMYKLLNLLKYINQGRSQNNLLGNGELARVPNSTKSPRTQVSPPSPTRIIKKKKKRSDICCFPQIATLNRKHEFVVPWPKDKSSKPHL